MSDKKEKYFNKIKDISNDVIDLYDSNLKIVINIDKSKKSSTISITEYRKL